MFSSSKATNLFPQISPCFQPSSSSSSSPLFGLNANEFFLHHHHQDLVSGHHLAANAAMVEPPNSTFDFPVSNKITTFENLNAFRGKHTAKKDRHSKICTSQGLRDRRVRLSISIARKFFDLQEMLGFDKPSKTLDWLLTNSKTAIEELQFKINNRGGVSETSNELDGDRNGGGLFSCSSKREAAMYVMRESRAKARARARERTREKMSTKLLLNEADKIQPWNQIAKDLNSNCNSSPNAAEIWDFSSHSNLCAILDHPKFTIPTSNM